MGNLDYYFITVTSSGLVPQFDRESVPFIPDMGGDVAVSGAYQNELSNPQFATILFNADPVTNTHQYDFTAGTTSVDIAPDWALDVTAAGNASVTVSQVTPQGSFNDLTNPGTILKITSSSTSTIHLRQRIYGSPNLWGSGFISASFVARNDTGSSAILEMFYSQSNGSIVDIPIVTATLPASGSYATYSNSVFIDASTSAEFYPGAYIDIYFLIPNSVTLEITSVMLSSTGDVNVANIIYDQESNARQIDHLFHYYRDPLIQKPMPSYTLGWDFPYNPCQKLGATINAQTVAVANKSFYICDQTISFQTVPNVMSFTITQPAGLTANTITDTSSALIQYLDGKTARELLAGTISVQIKGYVANGTQTRINGNVTLWWSTDANLPDMNAGTSLVSGVTTGGVVSAGNGVWTEVTRSNRGKANFTLPVGTGDVLTNEGAVISLNGWNPNSDIIPSTTATYFAIVIGFETLKAGTSLVLRYCTLNAGDLASPPSPMNQAETLAGLQYYFETSYPPGTIPGTAPSTVDRQAYLLAQTIATDVNVYPTPIDVVYNTIKRTIPNFTFYNSAIASGNSVHVQAYVSGAATGIGGNSVVSDNWTTTVTTRNTHIIPKTAAILATGAAGSNIAAFGTANYHFEADARFGIVN
jgi:hypothetical protein